MAEVIDLTSSPEVTGPTTSPNPASAQPPPPNPDKLAFVDVGIAPSDAPPTIASLGQRFPGPGQLLSYLRTLPKSTLQEIIIASAGYSSANNQYAHCVYCHEIFDKENNGGCEVKHYCELEELDFDTSEFSCCGVTVSYVDWDENCHASPEDDVPYCYLGRHWERVITEDDKEEAGGEGDREWWRGWEESGQTCRDLRCRGTVDPKVS